MGWIKYFFPKRTLKEKIPPLSLKISSDIHPHKPVDDDHPIKMLMGHGVARTKADAHRLLYKHNNTPLHEIIKLNRPRRRFMSRLRRAWERLKAIW